MTDFTVYLFLDKGQVAENLKLWEKNIMFE